MLEKVKSIIADQLNIDAAELTEATNLKDDLGVDSLDMFEVVMAFEEEFAIEIPSEELEGLSTVGSIVEFLKGKGVEA